MDPIVVIIFKSGSTSNYVHWHNEYSSFSLHFSDAKMYMSVSIWSSSWCGLFVGNVYFGSYFRSILACGVFSLLITYFIISKSIMNGGHLKWICLWRLRVCELRCIWLEETAFDAIYPDSKVHGANMGPTWGRQDPGGPHVGPIELCYLGIKTFFQI